VQARTHIAANTSKAFPFAAYKDGKVKTQLEALFHGKCAYCESFYAKTQPVDVEHYRPKGRVAEAEAGGGHPGYWWLAMDWENLLPSCIDCNRKRGQTLPQVAMGTVLELHDGARFSHSVEINTGKQDSFPLAAGSTYATAETGDLALEKRLLLDPTRDRPDDHLVFHIDRQNLIGLVYPKPVDPGQPLQLPAVFKDPSRIESEANAVGASPAGAVSIQVYGLNRLALVQARTQALRDLELLLLRIENMEEVLLDIGEKVAKCNAAQKRARSQKRRDEFKEDLAFLTRIESKLKQLRDTLKEQMRAKLHDSAPYAAQARAWLAAYLTKT
jgi:hypothetical protein